MAVGDIITAARFNLLQGRIATIMGPGSGNEGYGQELDSSQVNVDKVITAEDLNKIYTDMLNARVHQTGSIPTVFARVEEGDIIAEETSTNPDGSLKGFADYEGLMDDIELDKFLLAGSQSTTAVGITSTRTLAWNGTITHEVRINFDTLDNARYFFNSGGELRITGNISGGSGAKTTDWASMLSGMGTIKFNYDTTTATGTGVGSNIGFYDLTSSYQTIFTKPGSGIYSQNLYKIEARQPIDRNVDIRITLSDPPYPSIDENVNGVLTSTISTTRATGVYVSVEAPAFRNLNSL